MGNIKGDRSVEIDAPIERCYEIAADIENAPDWQGSLKDVEVLERDGERRPLVVETESDAKVKTARARPTRSTPIPAACWACCCAARPRRRCATSWSGTRRTG